MLFPRFLLLHTRFADPETAKVFFNKILDNGTYILNACQAESNRDDHVKGPLRHSQGRCHVPHVHGVHQVFIGKPGHDRHHEGADKRNDDNKDLFHLRGHGIEKRPHADMPRFPDTVTDPGKGRQHHEKHRDLFGKVNTLEEGPGKNVYNQEYREGRDAKNQNGNLDAVDGLADAPVQLSKKARFFRLSIESFIFHVPCCRYEAAALLPYGCRSSAAGWVT